MRAIIYSPTGGVYLGCLITGQCFSREDAAKHFDAMSPTFDSVEKARRYWTSFGDSDLQDVTFLAVPTHIPALCDIRKVRWMGCRSLANGRKEAGAPGK